MNRWFLHLLLTIYIFEHQNFVGMLAFIYLLWDFIDMVRESDIYKAFINGLKGRR